MLQNFSVAVGKSGRHAERMEKMSKYYIIIAHDGTEVIDGTPEAGNRIAAMDYLESRYRRDREHKDKRQRKLSRNPLYRLACLCGIV